MDLLKAERRESGSNKKRREIKDADRDKNKDKDEMRLRDGGIPSDLGVFALGSSGRIKRPLNGQAAASLNEAVGTVESDRNALGVLLGEELGGEERARTAGAPEGRVGEVEAEEDALTTERGGDRGVLVKDGADAKDRMS